MILPVKVVGGKWLKFAVKGEVLGYGMEKSIHNQVVVKKNFIVEKIQYHVGLSVLGVVNSMKLFCSYLQSCTIIF